MCSKSHSGIIISHFLQLIFIRSSLWKLVFGSVCCSTRASAASSHYVVTEQPLIINCEKSPASCLNINRWTSLLSRSLMKVSFPLACNECWTLRNRLISCCRDTNSQKRKRNYTTLTMQILHAYNHGRLSHPKRTLLNFNAKQSNME